MRILDSIYLPARVKPTTGERYVNCRDRTDTALTCNRLLAALPDKELDRLGNHLEFVYLENGKEVCGEDEKPLYVYFPTTSIVAMLHRREDGSALEIGAVGCEGAVGAATFLEKGVFGSAIVQFEGGAYRANIAETDEIFHQQGYLQSLLMRYTWTFLSQVLRGSMSGRHWSVEQRLTCWLLERLDRLPTNELKMTQEMVAGMLDVRRESITESIGTLRRKGIIRCRRGSITVLDRDELEHLSGECYRTKHAAKPCSGQRCAGACCG